MKENEKYAKFKIDIQDFGTGISKENIGRLFIDFGKLKENSHMNL